MGLHPAIRLGADGGVHFAEARQKRNSRALVAEGGGRSGAECGPNQATVGSHGWQHVIHVIFAIQHVRAAIPYVAHHDGSVLGKIALNVQAPNHHVVARRIELDKCVLQSSVEGRIIRNVVGIADASRKRP
jgi:hypothetical protein